MKKSQLLLNSTVSLRISPDNPNKVEIVDNLIITSEMREAVLVPYIESLCKSLASRSKHPSHGVPRSVITEVIPIFIYF